MEKNLASSILVLLEKAFYGIYLPLRGKHLVGPSSQPVVAGQSN